MINSACPTQSLESLMARRLSRPLPPRAVLQCQRLARLRNLLRTAASLRRWPAPPPSLASQPSSRRLPIHRRAASLIRSPAHRPSSTSLPSTGPLLRPLPRRRCRFLPTVRRCECKASSREATLSMISRSTTSLPIARLGNSHRQLRTRTASPPSRMKPVGAGATSSSHPRPSATLSVKSLLRNMTSFAMWIWMRLLSMPPNPFHVHHMRYAHLDLVDVSLCFNRTIRSCKIQNFT
mmetsp:Transcript_18703/g.56069  ORF Transcript_18703/g.56069 Transcript_18703/m.56069 type:complete len:236 (+) Transcript_18703:942-1649(+)